MSRLAYVTIYTHFTHVPTGSARPRPLPQTMFQPNRIPSVADRVSRSSPKPLLTFMTAPRTTRLPPANPRPRPETPRAPNVKSPQPLGPMKPQPLQPGLRTPRS